MAEAGGEGGETKVEVYPYGEYEGSRDENLDRHGFGSALLPNGDIFEGNYLHGKRHGKGMYCFRNGSRYDGNWRKGLKHGKGQMLFPDGTRYIGDWRKDLKHGQGTYYYQNGDTYTGAWYKGFRHGLGTYFFKSVNVNILGTWKNGRMEGPGIINYPCNYKYHGSFEKNLPKGKGCYTFDGKWMQHGFYVNMRDPAFDYIGAEEMALEQPPPPQEGVITGQEEEFRGNPPGIVPIWRARLVTTYQPDLLPPEPVPIPVKDSLDSLIDIIDYLKKEYDKDKERMEEEMVSPTSKPKERAYGEPLRQLADGMGEYELPPLENLGLPPPDDLPY